MIIRPQPNLRKTAGSADFYGIRKDVHRETCGKPMEDPFSVYFHKDWHRKPKESRRTQRQTQRLAKANESQDASTQSGL